MQITNKQLVNELSEITESSLASAKNLKTLSTSNLNYRKSENEWSILECIEHLNLYGDYYLPEIENRILSAQRVSGKVVFKSGIIGNYFVNLIQVKTGEIKKMRSPKDKNPVHSILTATTIDRFIKQLERLKSILRDATSVDLVKTETSISLTKFIRLRLGDTLRFFVYHIERHVLQAEKVQAGHKEYA